MTKAWVDDVAQETFLIAYRKLDEGGIGPAKRVPGCGGSPGTWR